MSIKEQFGFFSQDDLVDLTDYSPRTLANWRSKRIGPPYVQLPGKPPLYPVESTLAWLKKRLVQTDAACSTDPAVKKHAGKVERHGTGAARGNAEEADRADAA